MNLKDLTARYEDFVSRYGEILDKYGDSLDMHDLRKSYRYLKENFARQITTYMSYNDAAEVSTAFEDDISRGLREYRGERKNPVILIHGFFGSQLADSKTGEDLWGNFHLLNSIRASAEKMRQIAHPMERGASLSELADAIEATKMLERLEIRFAGVQLKFPAYKDMIDILEKSGFRSEDRNLFLFAYDWRRDLPSNAAALADFVSQKKGELLEKGRGNRGKDVASIKFDIVAHSMGGLLTRYYLRYGDAPLADDGPLPKPTWKGAEDVERAVIVGTPNAGYLDTFLEMVKGSPFQPYPTAVLGTLPSYYQMLPAPELDSIVASDIHEPLNVFDVSLWERMGWGLAEKRNDHVLTALLPDIETESKRRAAALEHLEKCLKRARRFIASMSTPDSPPDGLLLHLVCGNGVKTTKRAAVTPKGRVDVVEYGSGDGKVLTSSALWDRRALTSGAYDFSSPIRWRNIILLRAAHMGITKAAAFEDNMRFLLTRSSASGR